MFLNPDNVADLVRCDRVCAVPESMSLEAPVAAVDGKAVNVRMERDALQAIDDWRPKENDLPGRPEAIRRLVQLGLKAKK